MHSNSKSCNQLAGRNAIKNNGMKLKTTELALWWSTGLLHWKTSKPIKSIRDSVGKDFRVNRQKYQKSVCPKPACWQSIRKVSLHVLWNMSQPKTSLAECCSEVSEKCRAKFSFAETVQSSVLHFSNFAPIQQTKFLYECASLPWQTNEP